MPTPSSFVQGTDAKNPPKQLMHHSAPLLWGKLIVLLFLCCSSVWLESLQPLHFVTDHYLSFKLPNTSPLMQASRKAQIPRTPALAPQV